MAAYIDAEEWMKANPEETISIVAEVAGMEDEDLAAIWEDYAFSVVLDDQTVALSRPILLGVWRPAIIQRALKCPAL